MKTILAILLLFALPSPASAGEESQTYLVRIAFKNPLEHPVQVFLHPKYTAQGNGGIVSICRDCLSDIPEVSLEYLKRFRIRPMSDLPDLPPPPTISIGPENSGSLEFKEFGTRNKEIHFCFHVVAVDLPNECHLAHFTLGDLPGPGRALFFTVRGNKATFPEYRGSNFSIVKVEGLGSTSLFKKSQAGG